MEKPITTNGYIAYGKVARHISIITAFLLLSGCLGGTIAQQIVRSIATSVADNAIANAMDVNEDAKPHPRQNIRLADRTPSDLSFALRNTAFRMSPDNTKTATKRPIEKPLQIIKASTLVRATVFNLVIDQERDIIYEKAQRIGALNLPNPQDWKNWHVVAGVIEDSETPIIFITPPELGKPISGSVSIVELAKIGNLNIARYTVSQHKIYQAMDETSTALK